MRLPGRERRRRTLRPRIVIIVLVVLGFILLSSMRGIAGFYTDYLWFKGIGVTEVWRGLIWAKLLPTIVFTVVFFGVLLANLIVADRIAPQFHPAPPAAERATRRPPVPQGHRLLRLHAAVPEIHRGVDVRGPRDPVHRHRARALPQRRHPAPRSVPARRAPGDGPPVGDPRGDGVAEGAALLPAALRAELLDARVLA